MIHVINNLYIDVEDRQYIVKKERVVETGKHAGEKVYESDAFCKSFLEALETCKRFNFKNRIKDIDCHMELCDAIFIIKQMNNEFKDLIESKTGGIINERKQS